jgi:eukaryotic-like serine/threonine-protein kinase
VQAGVTPSKFLPPPKPLFSSRFGWKRWAIAGAVVVAAIAGALGSARVRQWFGSGAPPISQMHLAVLPLTPASNDSNSRAFAEGLTETLAMRLTQLTTSYPLQIVPPREIAAGSIQTAEQARRNFGVNLVLEGGLRESNNLVRVSYSLVDAAKLTQLRADTVTVDASKPFEIEDRVLESMVTNLGLALQPREKEVLFAHGTQEPAAYDYYLRGRGYLQEFQRPENIDSAITVFNHALEKDPNYALAYAGLGEAYLHKYDRDRERSWVDQALSSCDKAVSLADGVANGHVCLGMVYNNTGHYEEAVQQMRRAVDIDPTSDDAFRGLAYAYERSGRSREAEQTFRRAIQLRPQYWGGYAWLGGFYYHQARYDDAARMYTEMIALAPDSFQAYSNLGAMYLLQGRYSDAIPQFRRSVDIYPSVDALSNLGAAYFFEGNFADAAKTYERAVEIGKKDSMSFVAWSNLAEAYYWIPDQRSRAVEAYRKAIGLAEENLKVNPKDATVLRHLALFHAMLGEGGAAQSYMRRALELSPNSADVQFFAGKVDAQLHQSDLALAALRKAVDLGFPKSWIRDDPIFKPLASNVQFHNLVQ